MNSKYIANPFKVGDKVKVRDDLNKNFCPCDKLFDLTVSYTEGKYVGIKEWDDDYAAWSYWRFEKVKKKKKIG